MLPSRKSDTTPVMLLQTIDHTRLRLKHLLKSKPIRRIFNECCMDRKREIAAVLLLMFAGVFSCSSTKLD